MTATSQGHDYDVVVVGARPAGAATGLLLARAGLRVLIVDEVQIGALLRQLSAAIADEVDAVLACDRRQIGLPRRGVRVRGDHSSDRGGDLRRRWAERAG